MNEVSKKKRKKLGWKGWTGIVAAVFVIGAIGGALGDDDDQKTAAATMTSSPSADASEAAVSQEAAKASQEAADASKKAKEEKKQAEKKAAEEKADKEKQEAVKEAAEAEKKSETWADDMYQYWLTNLGVKTPLEILEFEPTSIQAFVNGVESPSMGTLVFTVQVTENEVDKEELKRSAMAMLQIIGYEHEELDRVELVTADSLKRGVANRYNSPLLNR